jgi:hypothetical protein
MLSPLPVPGANAGVSELLQAGARLFRLTLPKCLPIAMVAALISQIPGLLLEAQGQQLKIFEPPTDPKFWVEYGIAIVLVVLLFALVTVRQRTMLRGQLPDLGREVAQVSQRMPILLPASMLALLAYCVGCLLLLPGIYLLVCFAVLPAVVMFEEHSIFGSLKRSIQLMNTRWIQKFAVFLIGFLIALVCILAAALLVGVALEAASDNFYVQAIQRTLYVGFFAVMWSFLNALSLVLYTSASSSA